jgi:hypothetical protein
VLVNVFDTAPETWGDSHYDEKSDVFSFAIIIYDLFGSSENYIHNKEENDDKEYFIKNGRIAPDAGIRKAILQVLYVLSVIDCFIVKTGTKIENTWTVPCRYFHTH